MREQPADVYGPGIGPRAGMDVPPSPASLERGHAHPRLSTLQVVLFFLTVVTTYLTGSEGGRNPIEGVAYSGALMSILLVHEMGHFLASRRHRVAATWPYFIPMPMSPFGTMGAVIAIRSLWKDRRALLDIGVAGPLAGFVLSVPALVIGLMLSTPHPGPLSAPSFEFGSSLLVSLLEHTVAPSVPDDGYLLIHPLGLAGWVGLFVTWLNLLPVGQLDGGHIAYALLGSKPVAFFLRWKARLDVIASERAAARRKRTGVPAGWPEPRRFYDRPPVEAILAAASGLIGFFGRSRPTFVGGVVFVSLIGWGVHGARTVGAERGGASWFFLAFLVLLFRFRHPPTHDDHIPLDKGRVCLGIIALLIFLVTFIPVPVSLIE